MTKIRARAALERTLEEKKILLFDKEKKVRLSPSLFREAQMLVVDSLRGPAFAKFQTSFYADPRDAVFKALGVE